MANQDRTTHEVLRRRKYPTTGTGVISIGDISVNDGSGNAASASSKNGGGSATANRDLVADNLIGVALHQKLSTETPDIMIGADVIAMMDVYDPAGLGSAAKVGDPVEIGIVDVASVATPTPQKVVLGSTNPIGFIAEAAPVGAKQVLVHIQGKEVKAPAVAD